MQNEPILGDIFRYSATGSSIKKPVFMRVCGHFEARRTTRHDPNDVAPKRQATGSNPAGGAKNDRCKPFFDGLQRFFVIVFSEHSCCSTGTILYIFRCMPANWLRTIFPALLIKNADLLIRFFSPIFQMGPMPAMQPVCWPVPATCEAVLPGPPNPMWRAPVPLVPPGHEPNAGQDWHRRRSQTSGR